MKTTLFSILTFAALGSSLATAKNTDVQSLLERASYLETGRGELEAAARLYRQIIAGADAHPEVVLQARFQLATCLLKQGNEAGARAALAEMIDKLPSREMLLAPREDGGDAAWDSVFRKISQKALKPIDEAALTNAVMEGIAESLGGHSDYFTPAELELFRIGMDQKLVGIGAMLDFTEGKEALLVKAIVPNSPAEKAKLMRGDKILAIDGKALRKIGSDLTTVVAAIRGKENTTVTLLIESENSGEIREFPIVRRTIELGEENVLLAPFESVTGEPQFMIDRENRIGGIRLKAFATKSATQVETRLRKLLAEGMKALVLDLRGNGGGSLDECIKIADLFVEDELIVATDARNDERKEHRGKAEGTLDKFPIAILVNDITASASEILAACLQDHKRAIVIGQRTYGKGTVETIMPVRGGGALKLSISEFYRPSGKAMKKPEDEEAAAKSLDWGVRPDDGFAIAPPTFARDITARERFVQDPAWRSAIGYLKEQLGK